MKLGFCHIPRWRVRDTVELLKDGERHGYTTGWLPDQAFFHDPYTTLTAAALETRSMRLGLGVTNAYASHPLTTARIAGSVADIAGGRFVLGIATGSPKDYLAPLGFSPAEGAERCRDALLVIRDLFAGGTPHYRTDYFVCDGAKLSVPPPHKVPLYIGGVGPKILEIAGEHADGVILNLASAASIGRAVAQIEKGMARRATALAARPEMVAWGFLHVTDDPKAAYDRFRPFIAYAIEITNAAALKMLGFDPGAIDKVRAAFKEGGGEKAAPFVTDAMIDNWMWIGTPDEIADQMAPLKQMGITEIVVLPWTNDLGVIRGMVLDFVDKAGARVTAF